MSTLKCYVDQISCHLKARFLEHRNSTTGPEKTQCDNALTEEVMVLALAYKQKQIYLHLI